MGSSTANLHPDYGPAGGGRAAVRHPVEDRLAVDSRSCTSRSSTPTESDPGPYPLSASTPIEGGSDRHAIMVNPSTCKLYELFNTRYKPGGQLDRGLRRDLATSARTTCGPDGWTSADAAGLPILPGLVNYDEVMSGAMNHAIRVTASCTQQLVPLAGAPPGRAVATRTARRWARGSA